MKNAPCTPTNSPVSHAVAGAALAAALELAGHWAPWPRRLPRLLAYSYGVAVILIGALVALDHTAWRRIVGVSVAAGGAVAASHMLDHALNQSIRQQVGHHDRNR